MVAFWGCRYGNARAGSFKNKIRKKRNKRDLCVCVLGWWWLWLCVAQCVSIGARRARGRGPPGALRPSPFDLWLGPHWTSLAMWLLPSLPLAPSLFFSSSFDVDRQGQHLSIFFFLHRRHRHPFLSCPPIYYPHRQKNFSKSFPLIRKSNFFFHPLLFLSNI